MARVAYSIVVGLVISITSMVRAQTPSLIVNVGHSADINSVAFSSDNRFLVTGSDDKSIKLWEAATGTELRTFFARQSAKSVAFTPDARFVVGCTADTAAVWEIATGKQVRFLRATNIACSPDGRFILMVSFDYEPNKIHKNVIYEVVTGKEIGGLRGVPLPLVATAFSPDGHMVVTSTYWQDVTLWEVATGKQIRNWRSTAVVESLLFSSDGRVIVGRTSDSGVGRAWAWETETGKELRSLDSVSSMAISPYGNFLVTGDTIFGGLATLSDLDTGSILRRFEDGSEPSRINTVTSIAISADGSFVALSKNNNAELWDVTTGRKLRIFKSHTNSLYSLAFNSQRRLLVTSGSTINLWDLQLGTQVRRLKELSNSLAFSRNGEYIVSGGSESVIIWNLQERKIRRLGGVKARFIWSVAVSDNNRFIAGGGDSFAQLWDAQSGRLLATLEDNHSDRISVAFSPDERLLATAGGSEGKVTFWSTTPPFVDLKTIEAHKISVTSIAFSPNGRLLATGSIDRTVKVWDVDTGAEIRTFKGHLNLVNSVMFTKDGQSVVSGSNDGTLKLWDVATGRDLRTFTAVEGLIGTVALSHDSKYIVAGLRNGTSKIWDFETATLLCTLITVGEDDWLIATPDGLFDGSPDAIQNVAWRLEPYNTTVGLDSFFNDFYYPGLLAEIMAGGSPKAQMDIATAMQIPSLRIMLAQKQAHLEERGDRVVVCFEEKPGAVINVGPNDRRMIFPTVHGYTSGTTSTCNFEKELPRKNTEPSVLMHELRNWKPEVITTPWDAKLSDTKDSTLHVLPIAISNYPLASGFEPLPYTISSAKAIEAFFRTQAVSPTKPYANVRVWGGLYDEHATRDNVRQGLSIIAREVSENDVVLLYLAGHGKVSPGEEMFYFVPIDGLDGELRDTGLSTAIIADALRKLPARRIVVIVDACQSGGAIEALGKIGKVKARAEQQRAQLESNATESGYGMGVHLIAATLPLSYAVGLKDGQSVLAKIILDELQQGSGQLTVNQLATDIKRRLPTTSEQVTRGFRQVPLIDSIGLDFPIAQRE